MKKIILSMAMVASLVSFTSCGDDDEGGSNSSCVECETTALGVTSTTEYCDNGDGTVDITTEVSGFSTTTTIDLPEGFSFDEYTDDLTTACN